MRITQTKLKLLELFIRLFLGNTLQKVLSMLLMLVLCFRVDENAIVKDYNKPVVIVFEDTIR